MTAHHSSSDEAHAITEAAKAQLGVVQSGETGV